MSNEPKPNKAELIPSINRSLAIKRSGLVKRGLELLQEKKQQQVRVLIGNHDDLINDLFSKLIKRKCDSKIRSSYLGEEILEIAENGVIDIFILIMNNIWFPGDSGAGLVQSLRLITQIKTTYGRPVIALSGWEGNPSQIKKAKLIADFYLPLPFKSDAFLEAFEQCLKMLPIFDEVSRKRFKGSAGHDTT